MLRFFKTARDSFSNSGSLRKYLIYAIGEILLVMIGILLALQVNNWNDERINFRKEQDLLRILNDELALTHEYLGNRVGQLNEILEKDGMEILNYIQTPENSVSVDSFSFHLIHLFNIGGFAPQIAKFQQVIGGDGVNLIRYDSLQLLLQQYQNQLELAFNHGDKMEEDIELRAFWNKHMPVRTILNRAKHGWHNFFENRGESSFDLDLKSVFSNPEFENIVVNRMMLLNSTKKRLERVQAHIRKILTFISIHYSL